MNKGFRFLSILAIAASTLFFVSSCTSEGEGGESESTSTPAVEKTSETPTAVEEVEEAIPSTNIAFEEMEWDFGNIQEGETVTHIFKFTNSGSEPLIINNARGSCGCTVPRWPKEPIAPGASSEIEVSFDSKKKFGNQTKTVTISANTEPKDTRLTIKTFVEGEPEAKEEAPAPVN